MKPLTGGVVSKMPSSSRPSSRNGSPIGTARTVARPSASRAIVSGAAGGGGPSMTMAGLSPRVPAGLGAGRTRTRRCARSIRPGRRASAGAGDGTARRAGRRRPFLRGGCGRRRRPGRRGSAVTRLEARAYPGGHLVLDVEEIGDRAVDGHGVDYQVGADVDDPGGDAESIAESLEGAAGDPCRS